MHKQKILVIGTTDYQGGAARVGWDLGHELIKRGYDVKYLVGYKKSEKKYVYELRQPIMFKWLDEFTKYNTTGLFRHLRSFILANNIDFGASSEILDHPWYKAADIVHCHNLHGNYFKLETLVRISQEKKVVWTLHDMSAITGKCAYTTNPSKWSPGYYKCHQLASYPPMLWDNTKYMWNKKKYIYTKCGKISVISPSNWLAKIVNNSILSNHAISTIYNGVDPTIFKKIDKSVARKELNLPLNKKIVLFVADGGTKDPRKGWIYTQQAIKAASNIDNLYPICIGNDSNMQRVQNVGYVRDRKILAKYYSASDVLLFTSTAENCPLVVLEAMSCGLPVISFDVGGVKELVEHKLNGWIAKYKDNGDLISGIYYIFGLENKSLKTMRSINSKKVKEKYSIEKMTDNYIKLYKSL